MSKYRIWKDPGMWTPPMIWWRIRVWWWARQLTPEQKREMGRRAERALDRLYTTPVEYGMRSYPKEDGCD